MLLEVQTLDVISVNIWQILISLANLLLLYFVFRKLLFKPIQRIFTERRADIDKTYAEADEKAAKAERDRALYEEKLSGAKEEAGTILADAKLRADRLGEEILAGAREEARAVREAAEADIAQQKRKAVNEAKDEIASLSVGLAEKILGRELNAQDGERLIDDFLAGIEDDHE